MGIATYSLNIEYRGLPCSMHSMGLGIAKGDLHGYIGKGHIRTM